MSETENAPVESDAEPTTSRTALHAIVGSLVVVIAAVVVAAVVIANNHDTKPGRLPDGTRLTKAETHGRELFSQTCATCHRLKASNSTGSVGPNLDNVAPSVALVKAMVTNGAAGGGQMPAGLYSGKDLDDVAAYVNRATHHGKSNGTSSTGSAAGTPAPSAPTTSTSAAAPAGDATAGKQVFATTCAACHGTAGHGGGGGGPDLRTMPLAKTAAGVTQQVTNGGGGMPAFKSQLNAKQIADVAAYVSTTVAK